MKNALLSITLALMAATSATAESLSVVKDVRFTWTPSDQAVPGLGSATWGQNTARDNNLPALDTKPEESQAFALSLTGPSLAPTKRATATAGAAKAEVEIGVGPATVQPNGDISVDGKIQIDLEAPAEGKGGSAQGRGRINLNGKQTVTGLTVDGQAVVRNRIGPAIGALKKKGVYLDPLSLSIADEAGTVILPETDFFEFGFDFSPGANVTMDASDSLVLELFDDPFEPASANFFARTLVDWASSSLEGTASLTDGVFTGTGDFADTSLWTFVYSTVEPSFIRRAILTGLDVSNIGVSFAAPVDSSLEGTDVDFRLGSSASASLVIVPEPSSLVLSGLGLIGLIGLVWLRSAHGIGSTTT